MAIKLKYFRIYSSDMARGMKCPRCGNYMYAQEETPERGKNRVYYVCRNSSCDYAITVYE